ncbi:uncharacterized protein M8220_017663 isoform 1-T3 [Acridotheres tristis]
MEHIVYKIRHTAIATHRLQMLDLILVLGTSLETSGHDAKGHPSPLEPVQLATRMDRGLGRLRKMELFRQKKKEEERRQKTDTLRLFIYLKGHCKEKENHLFLNVYCPCTCADPHIHR